MSETSVILIVVGLLIFLLWRLQERVAEVHRATNSMKDALVAAANALGREQGMSAQRAIQAQLELQKHLDAQARLDAQAWEEKK